MELKQIASFQVDHRKLTEGMYTSRVDGDVVTYGAWEGEPLLWRVVDREGDKRLLLAEKIVARQPYNKEYDNTYWQTSTLRRWLNQTFFQQAFSLRERSRILNTRMKNTISSETVAASAWLKN